MTKKVKPAAPPADSSTTLQLRVARGESEVEAHSRAKLNPVANSAVTVLNFHPIRTGCDIGGLIDEIAKQTKRVQNGDMSGPEAILVSQAHALDVLFSSLAQKAALNMGGGYLQATEAYLRLALKAQSQCRTTIEALGELKHPRTATFIKQANIAGQQQVNNADTRTNTHTGAQAGAREKDITPTNEQLTEDAHAPMDTRAASASICAHPDLETVGTVDRAKH
jgi:hypothetical protein